MRMRTSLSLQGWTVIALLLASTVYAIAEEFTLTTYYPSPRGVYRELRVGSANVSGTPAFLHIVGDGTRPGFSVESGASTQMTVLGNGNTGLGEPAPAERLHVAGNARIDGNLLVSGTGNIGSDLTVGGNLNITGDLTTNGLTVNGPALFTSTVTFQNGSPDVGKVWSATDGSGNGTWDYPKYAP